MLPYGCPEGIGGLGAGVVRGWGAKRRAVEGQGPRRGLWLLLTALVAGAAASAAPPPWTLVEKPPGVGQDVNVSPRPFRDAQHVALGTSLYFELKCATPEARETVRQSLALDFTPGQGAARELLRPGQQFVHGASGWLRSTEGSLLVYVEPGRPLHRATRYTVQVWARSPGAARRGIVASWAFTTEGGPLAHGLEYRLDLAAPAVEWHGQFFSGVCNVIFCTRATNYGPTWQMMTAAHQEHPRAWRLQRDFWLTGMEFRGPEGLFPSNLPNIVRERETRRIGTMRPTPEGVVLHLEDFFGHEQYGIASDRPVAADYHPGEEVLVADGDHSARARVVAADSAAKTVTLSPITGPPEGWKLGYRGPLPAREDPDAPGLFPPGGCYLRKYDPPGTACYYWGRLDKEWDLARRGGRRVLPNFADAPGDLARDGQSWTTVKDYAQWHGVARALAGHIIDRYGAEALTFPWSIFNEPDLVGLFWRGTEEELQAYYDYTSDAVLRAFEDRGYDSEKVRIGGLELGAIFGTNFVRLHEFLGHCSPRAQVPGAVPQNAAVADHRLDGQRSRRVETLCRAHRGKGAPFDFLSLHLYNQAPLAAAKLLQAKAVALAVDPEFYADLRVDSHEACPDWMPSADEAAGDVYLGDGYFPTWCADIVAALLGRASTDPRYAYGETLLTVWPPPDGLAPLNAVTRVIHYRAPGDPGERTVTLPMPIFHVLGLLSDFGPRYWVWPPRVVGSHRVGGFASRDERGVLRVLLYTHDPQDTQSRSAAAFRVTLEIAGWAPQPLRVREYRFDKRHNSCYALARALRHRTTTAAEAPRGPYTGAVLAELEQAAACHPTRETTGAADGAGRLRWSGRVAGNGLNVVVFEPAGSSAAPARAEDRR